MNDNNGVPKWFWVVSGLGLLWNLLGGAMFVSYMRMDDEVLAKLSTGEQTYYQSLPGWYDAVFGIAVLAGIIGCIGLLMRKGWAFPMLLVSLLAVIAQNAIGYGMFDAVKHMGSGTYYITALIAGFGALLVWFAKSAKSKGYLH